MSAKTDAPEQGRVSKREFLQRVSQRSGVNPRATQMVYDAFIEEILDQVKEGNRVTLTGFGKFYLQQHKGHRVRVEGKFKEGSREMKKVDDYAVLKFSATRSLDREGWTVGASLGAEKNPGR